MQIDPFKYPRYKIYDLHQVYEEEKTLDQFYLFCAERSIDQFDIAYFKSLVSNKNFNSVPALFKAVQELENKTSIVKTSIPKYVMLMSFDIDSPNEEYDEIKRRTIHLLDELFGKSALKLIPKTTRFLSVELSLMDDTDLATFNAYTLLQPELFYIACQV